MYRLLQFRVKIIQRVNSVSYHVCLVRCFAFVVFVVHCNVQSENHSACGFCIVSCLFSTLCCIVLVLHCNTLCDIKTTTTRKTTRKTTTVVCTQGDGSTPICAAPISQTSQLEVAMLGWILCVNDTHCFCGLPALQPQCRCLSARKLPTGMCWGNVCRK